MSTEIKDDRSKADQNPLWIEKPSSTDAYLSMPDIFRMVIRHGRAIILFAFLSTIGAIIFLLVGPKNFEAEGYVQIIPSVNKEGRVDKDFFETMIVSYYQKASSAFILQKVSYALSENGKNINPLDLAKRIKIKRVPKADLLRVVAIGKSQDEALTIAELWINKYLEIIKNYNIQRLLSETRTKLKEAQSELLEKKAAADKLRVQAEQTTPLITVSRAVDDRQLWNNLTQQVTPQKDVLKKLSEIHIKGQEQSEDYINLMKALTTSEQALAAANAKRDLFEEVELLLELRFADDKPEDTTKTTGVPSNKSLSEAEKYLNAMVKNNEVIKFGDPGLINPSLSASVTIGLVFFLSLTAACFYSFFYEAWIKK